MCFNACSLVHRKIKRGFNMRNKMLLAFLLASPFVVNAGPFGLEMGMSLEELKKQMSLHQITTYGYATFAPPHPHPRIISYVLAVTPDHGLCWVTGSSNVSSVSVYGTELIEEFESFEKALTQKYGKAADRFDFLKAGSIWRASNEWMIALNKRERTLSSYWISNKKNKLLDNISLISIEAEADDQNSGSITITYEFNNWKQCGDFIRSKVNSSL
jgi:hypothetical protein